MPKLRLGMAGTPRAIRIAFDTEAFAQVDLGSGRPKDNKGANLSRMDWWTLFYSDWWIAWAPFVCTSMARISRRCTIKQVMHTLPFLRVVRWFFGAAGMDKNRSTILENIGSTGF
eukprot:s5359_g1.t1